VREARAPARARDAIDALLDAGRVYREQVQSPDKALACFEEALRGGPRNGEALRALASLLSARRTGIRRAACSSASSR
jgi:tetratricopeptide (TPR) repeat protein